MNLFHALIHIPTTMNHIKSTNKSFSCLTDFTLPWHQISQLKIIGTKRTTSSVTKIDCQKKNGTIPSPPPAFISSLLPIFPFFPQIQRIRSGLCVIQWSRIHACSPSGNTTCSLQAYANCFPILANPIMHWQLQKPMVQQKVHLGVNFYMSQDTCP